MYLQRELSVLVQISQVGKLYLKVHTRVVKLGCIYENYNVS